MLLDILDVDLYTDINKTLPVTSAYILSADGNPDPDGLFSYTIFGRPGTRERQYRCGHIELKRKFLHPFAYNMILQMYRNLPLIISGERYVKVGKNGAIETTTDTDPDGATGIQFFIDNWKKIKWNTNDSSARAKKEDLFSTMKERDIFVEKWPVVPALMRDINLHNRESGRIEVGEVNEFYMRLLNITNSESILFDSSYHTQSNAQNTLVDIHNYFMQGTSKKKGLIRSGTMGKTVDYSMIGVISAPRFNSETYKGQLVPYNYIGVPLAIVCATFFPLVLRGLEDLFFNANQSTKIMLGGSSVDVSDAIQRNIETDTLKNLLKAYVKDKNKAIRTARFTLSGDGQGVYKKFEEQLGRDFTVTDLLFRVAADVVYNRNTLSTRFPITDSASTIFNKIRIITTEKTIDMSNGAADGTFTAEYFRFYPYFPHDKNGKVLADKVSWIDTLVPNNAFLAGQGGDYDGFC